MSTQKGAYKTHEVRRPRARFGVSVFDLFASCALCSFAAHCCGQVAQGRTAQGERNSNPQGMLSESEVCWACCSDAALQNNSQGCLSVSFTSFSSSYRDEPSLRVEGVILSESRLRVAGAGRGVLRRPRLRRRVGHDGAAGSVQEEGVVHLVAPPPGRNGRFQTVLCFIHRRGLCDGRTLLNGLYGDCGLCALCTIRGQPQTVKLRTLCSIHSAITLNFLQIPSFERAP